MQLECGEKLIRLILINSVAQFKNQLIMQYHKKIGEAVFEIWQIKLSCLTEPEDYSALFARVTAKFDSDQVC